WRQHSPGRASRYLAPAEPKHPPAPIGPSGQRQPKPSRDHFLKSIARRRHTMGRTRPIEKARPPYCGCRAKRGLRLMTTSIGAGDGAGNGGGGPKVSRAHVEPHPVAKPEPTVTWPVKDSDVLVGTVKLSKGVYECVLPDGSIIETFKTHKFALEFLHQ